MTEFNPKTHDTDVGSHGGQSRQMMEVFENQEFDPRVAGGRQDLLLCKRCGESVRTAKALRHMNPYAPVKRHCRGP